jgi:probable phosphoglycerate mutase
LQRTLETAEPIARMLGLPVEPRPRLTEVGFGEWSGRTMADLGEDPRWEQFNRLRSVTRAPGGELMLDVQSRIVNEFEELRARHICQTIALVSHQDTIRAGVAHYLGISLDLFHRLEIGPASVSVVQLTDWGPRILTVNNTGDL